MRQDSEKRNYRLTYCKICQYRDYDVTKGITCALTKEVADFEYECPSMQLDFEALEDVQIDAHNEIIAHIKQINILYSIKKENYIVPNHPFTPQYHSKENTHGLKIRLDTHENIWTVLSAFGTVASIAIVFNTESNAYKGLFGFLAVILGCFFLARIVIDFYTPKKVVFSTDALGFVYRGKRFFWNDLIDFRILHKRGKKGYFNLIIVTTMKGVQSFNFFNIAIDKDQLLEILVANRKDYLIRYERQLPDII